MRSEREIRQQIEKLKRHLQEAHSSRAGGAYKAAYIGNLEDRIYVLEWVLNDQKERR